MSYAAKAYRPLNQPNEAYVNKTLAAQMFSTISDGFMSVAARQRESERAAEKRKQQLADRQQQWSREDNLRSEKREYDRGLLEDERAYKADLSEQERAIQDARLREQWSREDIKDAENKRRWDLQNARADKAGEKVTGIHTHTDGMQYGYTPYGKRVPITADLPAEQYKSDEYFDEQDRKNTEKGLLQGGKTIHVKGSKSTKISDADKERLKVIQSRMKSDLLTKDEFSALKEEMETILGSAPRSTQQKDGDSKIISDIKLLKSKGIQDEEIYAYIAKKYGSAQKKLADLSVQKNDNKEPTEEKGRGYSIEDSLIWKSANENGGILNNLWKVIQQIGRENEEQKNKRVDSYFNVNQQQ